MATKDGKIRSIVTKAEAEDDTKEENASHTVGRFFEIRQERMIEKFKKEYKFPVNNNMICAIIKLEYRPNTIDYIGLFEDDGENIKCSVVGDKYLTDNGYITNSLSLKKTPIANIRYRVSEMLLRKGDKHYSDVIEIEDFEISNPKALSVMDKIGEFINDMAAHSQCAGVVYPVEPHAQDLGLEDANALLQFEYDVLGGINPRDIFKKLGCTTIKASTKSTSILGIKHSPCESKNLIYIDEHAPQEENSNKAMY